MKRLALFVFFDKNGIIQEYVIQYLNKLQSIVNEILFICNGNISKKSQEYLLNHKINFIIRPNRGFDFSAWKDGLNYYDTEINSFDEIILCNCSCYAVFPFIPMFSAMDSVECDFWGINRQPNNDAVRIGPKDCQFPLTSHIQSYFMVFRKSAIHSVPFKNWWKDLKDSLNYWDEVKNHEMRFSPYLEKGGLKSSVFMDPKKYDKLAPDGDACYACADIQLNDGNPLVKRKLLRGFSEAGLRVWRMLRENPDFRACCLDCPWSRRSAWWQMKKYSFFLFIFSPKKHPRWVLKRDQFRFWFENSPQEGAISL